MVSQSNRWGGSSASCAGLSHTGPCLNGSCAQQAFPVLPEMSPHLGECTRACLSCGLASDAGSSMTPVPLPAPLLAPDVLHAPRILLAPGPAAWEMAQGFAVAWQGSLAAAASTLLLALAVFCGLWCSRAVLVSVHRACPHLLGHWAQPRCSPSLPCADCVLQSWLLAGRGAAQLRLSQFELHQVIPMLSIILMKSEPGPLIFFFFLDLLPQPTASNPALGHKQSKLCCRQTFFFLPLLFWQRLVLLCGFSQERRVPRVAVRSQAAWRWVAASPEAFQTTGTGAPGPGSRLHDTHTYF